MQKWKSKKFIRKMHKFRFHLRREMMIHITWKHENLQSSWIGKVLLKLGHSKLHHKTLKWFWKQLWLYLEKILAWQMPGSRWWFRGGLSKVYSNTTSTSMSTIFKELRDTPHCQISTLRISWRNALQLEFSANGYLLCKNTIKINTRSMIQFRLFSKIKQHKNSQTI